MAGAGGGRGGNGGAGGTSACTSGPVGTISGALATGVAFLDTAGERVNAHGGGIIKVGDTFYMHGMYFLSTTTDNNFYGFSMYSSRDLATWKNEGIILPRQASGELGPSRKGERPHIIRCPSTGEFVLYAHAASEDYQTDKEIVYATSSTVNGQYAYKGPLKNASGAIIAHSDMSAYADDTGRVRPDRERSRVHPGERLPQLAVRQVLWGGQRRLRRLRITDGVQGRQHLLLDRLVQDRLARQQQLLFDRAVDERTVDVSGIPGARDGSRRQHLARANVVVAEHVGSARHRLQRHGLPLLGRSLGRNREHRRAGQAQQPRDLRVPAAGVHRHEISLPTYKTTWTIDVGAGTWSQ